MVPIIIFLCIVLAGMAAVAILLFNEKKSGSEVLQRFQSAEKLIQTLTAENEKFGLRVKGLEEQNVKLSALAKEREHPPTASADETRSAIAQLIDQTKLKDIMTAEVFSVQANASFGQVARKMKEYNIRHLPIVDEHGKLVGLITQRMLYKIQSPRKLIDGEWYYDEEMLSDVILKHVMVQDVFTLGPEHSMGKALMKMVYSKFGSIPIVDNDNKLVGIVTRKDILKTAARIYEAKYKHERVPEQDQKH